MDANCFDALVRSIDAAVPRRSTIGGLLAVGSAALAFRFAFEESAAKKRKKKKKKCKGGKIKCGKTCFNLQTDPAHCGSCSNTCDESEVCLDGICACPVDETECGGVCCAAANCIDSACCPADRTCDTVCCAADEICGDPETELCVVGQGACPSGADSCAGNAVSCNSPETCGCFQSTSGATRCGKGANNTDCGQCSSDTDCEVLLAVAGAFCADFGGSCPCADGQNACFIPCPG